MGGKEDNGEEVEEEGEEVGVKGSSKGQRLTIIESGTITNEKHKGDIQKLKMVPRIIAKGTWQTKNVPSRKSCGLCRLWRFEYKFKKSILPLKSKINIETKSESRQKKIEIPYVFHPQRKE